MATGLKSSTQTPSKPSKLSTLKSNDRDLLSGPSFSSSLLQFAGSIRSLLCRSSCLRQTLTVDSIRWCCFIQFDCKRCKLDTIVHYTFCKTMLMQTMSLLFPFLFSWYKFSCFAQWRQINEDACTVSIMLMANIIVSFMGHSRVKSQSKCIITITYIGILGIWHTYNTSDFGTKQDT